MTRFFSGLVLGIRGHGHRFVRASDTAAKIYRLSKAPAAQQDEDRGTVVTLAYGGMVAPEIESCEEDGMTNLDEFMLAIYLTALAFGAAIVGAGYWAYGSCGCCSWR